MATDNECPICQESLHGPDSVGCTVPCGHLFHRKCFESWQIHGLSTHSATKKCPCCKVQLQSFIDKLHISLTPNAPSPLNVTKEPKVILERRKALSNEKSKRSAVMRKRAESRQALADEVALSLKVLGQKGSGGGGGGEESRSEKPSSSLSVGEIERNDTATYSLSAILQRVPPDYPVKGDPFNEADAYHYYQYPKKDVPDAKKNPQNDNVVINKYPQKDNVVINKYPQKDVIVVKTQQPQQQQQQQQQQQWEEEVRKNFDLERQISIVTDKSMIMIEMTNQSMREIEKTLEEVESGLSASAKDFGKKNTRMFQNKKLPPSAQKQQYQQQQQRQLQQQQQQQQERRDFSTVKHLEEEISTVTNKSMRKIEKILRQPISPTGGGGGGAVAAASGSSKRPPQKKLHQETNNFNNQAAAGSSGFNNNNNNNNDTNLNSNNNNNKQYERQQSRDATAVTNPSSCPSFRIKMW